MGVSCLNDRKITRPSVSYRWLFLRCDIPVLRVKRYIGNYVLNSYVKVYWAIEMRLSNGPDRRLYRAIFATPIGRQPIAQ